MAATETVNSDQVEVEKVVTRWLVDYYFSLAVEFYRTQQTKHFCAIRELLDDVLQRPIESVDDIALKVRILQFLSRISEGETLDVLFDQSKTPLESALTLLEDMGTNFEIPREDLEYASNLIKEMILRLFIRNKVFDKAKEALNLYFPKPENSKRAAFMSLICQKCNMDDDVIEINFLQFKMDILGFCQRLCPFTVPFLHKAALSLMEKRVGEEHDGAARIDEQVQPSCSSSCQANAMRIRSRKYMFIQKSRLEAAFKALTDSMEEKTFSELEEELEEEGKETLCLCPHDSAGPMRGATQSSEEEALFQRHSCSPMEASPADQPPQTPAERQAPAGSLSKTLYTVARFVVEPDSQPSSQCTTAPEELETKTKTEEPPQTPSPSKRQLYGASCPLTEKDVPIATRTLPRRSCTTGSRASISLAEGSSDSEDDSLHDGNNKLAALIHDDSNQSFSGASADLEQQDRLNLSKTPPKTAHTPHTEASSECKSRSGADACLTDSSVDSSPGVSSCPPQKSSTPHKHAQIKTEHRSVWKEKLQSATEHKEKWIEEDSYFPSISKRGSNESSVSNSGQRKRRWTESETQMLKEGVKRFGEGNWSKIRSYCKFKERTNVNLKDRWRTMKKLNLV